MQTAGDSKWTDVQCSNVPKLEAVQAVYLTEEGLGGETLVGNIKFGEAADTSKVSIPGNLRPNFGTNRILRSGEMPQNGYHDLKGRRFDKQIPYRVMF